MQLSGLWLALAAVASPETGTDLSLDKLEDMSLQELLEIRVVTASGVEERGSTAPANTIVINRLDLLRRGWRSLQEVLGDVLGLYVVNDLAQPSIGVRGVNGGFRAGSRIVKIMIDGVDVSFRPDETALFGPEFIPMEAVDRVEIAKGPLSALYGANAFLATVNVITKKAEPGAAGKLSMRLHQGAGWGYGGAATASYAGEHQSVLLATSGERLDRSGLTIQRTFEQDPDETLFAPFFGQDSHDDLSRPRSAFGKYELDAGDLGTLQVIGGLQQADTIGSFQPNSAYTDSRYTLRNLWLNARHKVQVNDTLSFWVAAGWASGAPTDQERLFLTDNEGTFYRRRFRYTALDGAAAVTAKLEKVSLTLGVDGTRETDRNLHFSQTFVETSAAQEAGSTIEGLLPGDVGRSQMTNLGVRLQATSTPLPDSDDLNLSGDIRLDSFTYFPNQVSWRGGVAYAWTSEVVTKLIVGHAFQTPSPVMMFAIPGFGLASNMVGSRTDKTRLPVVPQTIDSAELVSSATLGDVVALQLGTYVQRLRRRIEFVQASRNFVPINQGPQENAGIELALQLDLGAVHPFAQGAVSWHVDKENDGGLSLEPTPSYPSLLAAAGLTFDLPALYVGGSGQLRWVGERAPTQSNTSFNNGPYTLPAYYVVDATLTSTGFAWLGEDAETRFTLVGRNLLDKRTSEPGVDGFDVPMEGRTVLLEVQQAF